MRVLFGDSVNGRARIVIDMLLDSGSTTEGADLAQEMSNKPSQKLWQRIKERSLYIN